jgi:Ca2+-transporting ATPase
MASSSSSAFSTLPRAGRAHYQAPRSESPPASTYFPDVSEDVDGEPLPTADADSHFAYSTTLRRHHTEVEEEVQSLWQKFVRHVTGQGEYETLDSGHANVPSATDERKDTLSAKYALYTVEVCFAERLINSTDAVKLPSGNASPLSNEPSNGTTVIEYLFAPTSSRL